MTQGLLVGRARELTALKAALADARAGRGQLALLIGEAGIGKSRLARELAAGADLPVAWGRAWEAGGAPAYWPWIQILRALAGEASDADLAAWPGRAWISGLVPELGERLGTVDPPPSLEPERARFQLLDAVVGVLRCASRARPRMIVLEDLHAADASSLLLCDMLARELPQLPLLVIGTYREAEGRRGKVGPLLARLRRHAQSLPLARLSQSEVKRYLAELLERDDRAADVFAASEGNPLFVEEIARLLVERGDASLASLADGLGGLVRERLTALPDDCLALVEMASVLGRDHDLADLARLADTSVGALDAQLATCLDAGLIERDGERHRFTHILVREAVHQQIAPTRRWTLHRRWAALLERDGRPWAEIAHHLDGAGPDARDDALAAHLRAAGEASQKLAFDEAAEALRRALALRDAGAAGADRAEILVRLGHAEIVAGDHEAGRARCLEAAQASDDPARFAAAALAYGEALIIAEVDPRLVELLEQALARLEGDPTSCEEPARRALRARLSARLAAALQPSPTPEEPIRRAHEAIDLARDADEETLLFALRMGSSAMMDVVDAADRIAINREHVALARRLDAPTDALRGTQRLAFDHVELGEPAEVEARVAECASLAAELSHPSYRWPAACLGAMLSIHRGDFAAAKTQLAEARRLAPAGDPNPPRTLVLQELGILRLRGADDEALARLPELDAVCGGSRFMQQMASVIAANVLARAGRLQEAEQRFAEADVALVLELGDASLFEPLAETLDALGRRDLAAALEQRLASRADRFVSWGVLGMLWGPPVAWVRGLAARLGGDDAAAARLFAEARAKAEAVGAGPHAAWCAYELARLGDEAARAAAIEGARRFGLDGLLARLEAPTTTTTTTAPVPRAAFTLRPEGDGWRIDHAGHTFQLRDAKGLRILARLVERPGRELHALDLSDATPTGDAGDLLDDRARADYSARIAALKDDLAEAESFGDIGRSERARSELEALTAELSRAFGLGGRKRRAGDAAERARVNVQRRLRDAIRRIEEHDAELARHLAWAVRTGAFCVYDPR